MENRIFENEETEPRFKLRAVVEDGRTWFVAQDVATAAGWSATIGRPTPARDLAGRYKTAKKIEQVSELDGRSYIAEVLCLTPQGVVALTKKIQKLICYEQTKLFLKWFRKKVLPLVADDKEDDEEAED